MAQPISNVTVKEYMNTETPDGSVKGVLVARSWRLLVYATVNVLLWSVPVMLLTTFLKASLLPWLEPRKDSPTGFFVAEIGAAVLGIVVWKSVRDTLRRDGENISVPWVGSLVWALFMSGILTALYQVCFVAAMVLVREGFNGFAHLPIMLS